MDRKRSPILWNILIPPCLCSLQFFLQVNWSRTRPGRVRRGLGPSSARDSERVYQRKLPNASTKNSPLASRMMMTFCGSTQTPAALDPESAVLPPISTEPLVSPSGMILTSPRSYVRFAQPLGRHCLSSIGTGMCSSSVTFRSPYSGRTPNRSHLL